MNYKSVTRGRMVENLVHPWYVGRNAFKPLSAEDRARWDAEDAVRCEVSISDVKTHEVILCTLPSGHGNRHVGVSLDMTRKACKRWTTRSRHGAIDPEWNRFVDCRECKRPVVRARTTFGFCKDCWPKQRGYCPFCNGDGSHRYAESRLVGPNREVSG